MQGAFFYYVELEIEMEKAAGKELRHTYPGILCKLFCFAFETSSCHELAFWICAFSLQPLKAEYVKGKKVLQLVEVLILFLLWWFETNYRLWVVAYMYKMK